MATWQDSLTGTTRDAAAAVINLFESYGLGTLAPKVVEYMKNGYSSETTSILLQETAEYKTRFAANQTRLKKGLPVLSPAEYLATEKSYRQIMSAAGLPVGFYDQPEDFKSFLENDLAPQEVQNRVKSAADFVNNAPQEAKNAFSQWYTEGDMIAYALDPTRAASAVERAYSTAAAAGYGRAQGLDVSQTRAGQVAAIGLSNDAMSQGFAAVASESGNARKLAQLENDDITADDLIGETFMNDSKIAEKRRKLASSERGRFGGSSGVGSDTLGRARTGAV